MTNEEEISKNREELNEARQDFRDTMTEVSAKAEHLEGNLRLDRLIEPSPHQTVSAFVKADASRACQGSKRSVEISFVRSQPRSNY
jgi:hypothetical protein